MYNFWFMIFFHFRSDVNHGDGIICGRARNMNIEEIRPSLEYRIKHKYGWIKTEVEVDSVIQIDEDRFYLNQDLVEVTGKN